MILYKLCKCVRMCACTYQQFYLQQSQRSRSYWQLHGVWAWPLAQVGVSQPYHFLESGNHSRSEISCGCVFFWQFVRMRVYACVCMYWFACAIAAARIKAVILFSGVIKGQSCNHDISREWKQREKRRWRQTYDKQEGRNEGRLKSCQIKK